MALVAFEDASEAAARLLAQPEVSEHWTHASALPLFGVAALAGHLLRGITVVESYLEGPEPEGEAVSASAYFHVLGLSSDVTTPANEAIRARGADTASLGAAHVAADAAAAATRLSARLRALPPDRRMRVIGGVVITLDEYLCTRVVELVVHGDDLATSIGLVLPDLAPTTTAVAIDTLVGVARLRHGDVSVLRGLARRERDADAALRVL